MHRGAAQLPWLALLLPLLLALAAAYKAGRLAGAAEAGREEAAAPWQQGRAPQAAVLEGRPRSGRRAKAAEAVGAEEDGIKPEQMAVALANWTAASVLAESRAAEAGSGREASHMFCCWCWKAEYDNGEIWKESPNKESGMFKSHYQPVNCHPGEDNKACKEDEKATILMWKPNLKANSEGDTDKDFHEACEAPTKICKEENRKTRNSKIFWWPSQLRDCLKRESATDIKAFCGGEAFRSSSASDITDYEKESRTCVKVKKKEEPPLKELPPSMETTIATRRAFAMASASPPTSVILVSLALACVRSA